ncbi:hypothetical protein SKAU_G00272310 [Synaphobranchus kaupii]|uniref:Uncharacterized protein n=1 Tax=Synaphobranchus kaupii TaxID=118154 RepID=A0A9Q1F0J1_SYNKA|nr:hypothetical protein SKAU_G00272310 [Synaphobranchus kaupii]
MQYASKLPACRKSKKKKKKSVPKERNFSYNHQTQCAVTHKLGQNFVRVPALEDECTTRSSDSSMSPKSATDLMLRHTVCLLEETWPQNTLQMIMRFLRSSKGVMMATFHSGSDCQTCTRGEHGYGLMVKTGILENPTAMGAMRTACRPQRGEYV